MPTYERKLRSEPCKEEYFNLHDFSDGDKHRFFAPSNEYVTDVRRFYKVLQCIKDDEKPVLMGDFNSSKGKQILIKFEMCRGE